MENQNNVKKYHDVSDNRLQEAINSMSYCGSTTGIEIDEIIDVFNEALGNRRAQQTTDAAHTGCVDVEHVGYVTSDRKIRMR